MTETIKTVLSLSVSGAGLTLLLLLLRPVLLRVLSHTWYYYLWLIVLLRFLLPFTPPQSLTGTAFQALPMPAAAGGTVSAAAQALPAPQAAAPAAQLPGVPQLVCVLWVLGAAGLFLRKSIQYRRFLHRLRAGQSEITDPVRREAFARLVKQAGIRRTVGLYQNPLAASPMLVGFWRPAVLLPTQDLTDADFTYTVLHELTHLKRRDPLYKWLVQLVVCLHWFNPAVYLMRRELSRTCELACDAAVLRGLPREARRAYGDMLLRAVRIGGASQAPVAPTALHDSKAHIKERLDAIMKCSKKSRAAVACSLLLTIALGAAAISAGAYAPSAAAQAAPQPSAAAQAASQPDAVPAAAQSGFRYTQNAYYEPPYIFELGWNLTDAAAASYPDQAALTLPDGTQMTLFFEASCKRAAQDPAALSALRALCPRLQTAWSDTGLPFRRPLVKQVVYVGDTDLQTLAADYYRTDNVSFFAAIYPSLPAAVQQTYADKAFADERIAFFSVMLDSLPAESTARYAEQAFQQDDIALFSCTIDYLRAEALEQYAGRAYQDNDLAFFAFLEEFLRPETAEQYAEQAYQADQLSFFATLADNLSAESKTAWIARASQDRRTDYYAVLVSSLPASDRPTPDDFG